MNLRSSTLRFLHSLLLLGLWLAAHPSHAAETLRGYGLPQACQVEAWLPSADDNEELRESWTFWARSKDGSLLQAKMLHSNQGFEDHKAAFRLELTLASGKKLACRAALPADSWRSHFDAIQVQTVLDMGRLRANLGLPGHELLIDCAEISGKLAFENLSPPWQPGDGRLESGSRDKGLFQSFPSLRARVRGELNTSAGSMTFDGRGWIQHRRLEVPAQDLWRRRFSFNACDPQASLHCELIELSPAWGGGQQGYCALADENGLQLGSARMQWTLSAFIRDDRGGLDAVMPRQLQAQVDQGLSLRPKGLESASILLESGRLLAREDPAARLGSLMAWASRALNGALDYDFTCSARVELHRGARGPERRKFKQPCHFELNQL